MIPTPQTAPPPRLRLHVEPLGRTQWAMIGALLAVAAYAPALKVGLLSDDYTLAFSAPGGWTDWAFMQPNPHIRFYRPVGLLLTWHVQRLLWGLDPLPYHLVGLALHAVVVALLVGWLAALTGRPRLAGAAGALFAVLPLHLEAVAWVSAQWDLWAAAFGLTSLWAFTHWWQRGDRWAYALAWLAFAIGLLSKESLITFLPLFVVVAWYATPRLGRAAGVRLIAALVP